jgi:methylphosphotriester-DNA--protein-cysteine methyltransferase
MEPGLFPEESPRSRRGPLTATLALVLLSLALLLGYAGLQVRRLARERDRERARADELLALLRQSAAKPPPPAPAAVPETSPPSADPALPAPPAVTAAAPRAPDVRVVTPPASSEGAEERLRQGLAELRAARYPQAELHFFRALPEAYVYLLLSSLGRGDYRESVSFLARAAAADPTWFRKANPRDLLGAAEYERVLAALAARVRENPLDVEAKTLLAYLHYHEKGPAYAKALLVEATGLQPDHADARAFLEALER